MGLQLGLIGYPIQHSLSPWIHKLFMNKLNIDGSYQLFETKQEDLAKTLHQLKREHVDGFNITVPYKQAIIPFLDELDPNAEKIGAVNTVVNSQGKWKGYNTDGLGYVRSVKTYYPEVFNGNNSVLILGAGGAARGIYQALTQESFSVIDLANRTMEKAEKLFEVNEHNIETNIMSFDEAEKQLTKYDFVVQTTSVGMKPNIDEQVISLTNLSPNTVVSDIVYQPLMTAFLEDAKMHNGLIHQGHSMLLYQAQLAFEIWTGKRVNLDRILSQLEGRLRGN